MRHSASYVFVLALGYILKRLGVFGKQDSKVLTQVVLCVTLPAAVITNFASMEWSMSLLVVPVLGLVFSILYFMKKYRLTEAETARISEALRQREGSKG